MYLGTHHCLNERAHLYSCKRISIAIMERIEFYAQTGIELYFYYSFSFNIFVFLFSILYPINEVKYLVYGTTAQKKSKSFFFSEDQSDISYERHKSEMCK